MTLHQKCPIPLAQGLRTIGLVFLLLLVVTGGFSQTVKKDTATVNELLARSKGLLGEDPAKAVGLAQAAQVLAAKLGFVKGEATALKNIGVGYYFQQKYVEALDYWNQSLALFQNLKDEVGISNLLNNIGAVYMDKGDDARALEYCLRALTLAEKTNDKMRMMASLTTVASIYHNKKDPKAIDYLMKALPISKEAGNKESHAVLLGNIGEVFYDQQNDTKALPFFEEAIATDGSDASAAFAYNGIGKIYLRKKAYDLALQNHAKALGIAEKVSDKLQQLRALKGFANVHYLKQAYPTALDYFTRAKKIGEEINANVELKDLYQEMATTYAVKADYKNAFLYQTKYADIKDTLYNVETARKLGRLQFDFDLLKKEGEIKLLTNEKKMSEAELRLQRQSKTALLIGFCLLMVTAFIVFREYRIKARLNKVLDRQKEELQAALDDLKTTQNKLIQSEKMAYLGELTSGIAHEIQNPLNFVNNFSEINAELLEELTHEVQKGNVEEAIQLATAIRANELKVVHHGKRADTILKNMMQHAQKTSGTRQATDINSFVAEHVQLAYNGLRAKNNGVNVVIESYYDENIGKLDITQQEVGRVLLNLLNNAFYAVLEKKKSEKIYDPVVSISTKQKNGRIEITVKDNGDGIPKEVMSKIFQPFFTTKPTGDGTGLGLSLSYEIIKSHGGEISVQSNEEEGAAFTIFLPLKTSAVKRTSVEA